MLKRLGRTIRVRVRGNDHVVEKNGSIALPPHMEAQLLREGPKDWKKGAEEKPKTDPIALPDNGGKFIPPAKKGGSQ